MNRLLTLALVSFAFGCGSNHEDAVPKGNKDPKIPPDGSVKVAPPPTELPIVPEEKKGPGSPRDDAIKPESAFSKHLELELGDGIKMNLVLIPAGTFTMGSPPNERGRSPFELQHEVEITKPFYMGVYDVTQGEYEKVIGKNPSFFSKAGGGMAQFPGLATSRLSVDSVSWKDAKEFCSKLSLRVGKTVDLPTEAEWEYACRAGSTTAFHFGVNPPVGTFPANAWGLHDMHGNLYQWCKDWYDRDYYKNSPRQDPQGVTEGQVFDKIVSAGNKQVPVGRVIRGGCFELGPANCRSAFRDFQEPATGNRRNGFRVVVR